MNRSIVTWLWHIALKLIAIESRLEKTVTEEQLSKAVVELKEAMGSMVDLTNELSDVRADIRMLAKIAPHTGDTTPTKE